jgi:hypothetical protein
MIAPKISVTYEGPFFKHDPGKTMKANVQRAMASISRYTLQAVRELTPTISGETRTNIRARSTATFATAEAYGSDRDTYKRAWWLEMGRRRASASAGHEAIGKKVRWAKSAAKRQGGLVYMKKSPPKPYAKAATHLRTKVIADIRAELTKGLE